LRHGYLLIPRTLLSISLHSFLPYTSDWRLLASSNNLDSAISGMIRFAYTKDAPLRIFFTSRHLFSALAPLYLKTLYAYTLPKPTVVSCRCENYLSLYGKNGNSGSNKVGGKVFSMLKYLPRHEDVNKFGLGLLAFSDSEFDFWILWIYFWTFGRTFWTGDQPVARSLPTQDKTTQKNADTHPCFDQDSNPLLKTARALYRASIRTGATKTSVAETSTTTVHIVRVFEDSDVEMNGGEMAGTGKHGMHTEFWSRNIVWKTIRATET
jgi:hypothetical protein